MADRISAQPSAFLAPREASRSLPRVDHPPCCPVAHMAGASLTVEIVPLSSLAAAAPAWRALLERSCEPNPFYGPDFLLPLVRHLARRGRSFAAVAWSGEVAGERRMVGLLPFQVCSRLPGIAAPVLTAFTHPYIGMATPLVEREASDAILTALLDALARQFPESHLALDGIDRDGPVFQALARMAEGERALAIARTWDRAAIRRDLSSVGYLAERVSGKRLRDLRRCERLLQAEGHLSVETRSGPAAAGAVRDFLRIEEASWKGRQRTALACRPATLSFAHEALIAAPSGVVADVMTLDGVPVAVAVHLVAGDRGMAFKCAYDEAWSRASPGALLDLHTLRTVLDGGSIALMDSNALPGHPVEGLWRECLRLAHVLVGLDAAWPEARLAAHARRNERLAAFRARAKAVAKRILGHRATALRAPS